MFNSLGNSNGKPTSELTQSRLYGGVSSIAEKLAMRDREHRERIETFIQTLPAELRLAHPRECRGDKCDGWAWVWYGPLSLAGYNSGNGLAGFRKAACKNPDCLLSTQRQNELEDSEKQEQRTAYEQIEKARRNSLYQNSGMAELKRLTRFALEDYAQTANGSKAWFKRVQAWFRNFTEDSSGLVLLGGYGVGKTGVMVAGLRGLISELGVKVCYISAGDFVDRVGRAWRQADGSEFTLFERMENADVLFIDDLGAGHGNAKDWDDKSPMGKLFERLDKRYNAGKPTVITTNCANPDALMAVIGERNMNRIFDSCEFLVCEGVNLRMGVGSSDNDPWAS
jgi:DNA replication protein DnaC